MSRDELWECGALVDSRHMSGEARQHGSSIEATDTLDEPLARRCDLAINAAREAIESLRTARVRVVARAIREDEAETVETTITVAIGGHSIVTTLPELARDVALLRSLADSKPRDVRGGVPILWQNGSASVLFHEAIGHAREQCAPAVAWPSWLSVETPIVYRRQTFRDVPLPRMTHLIASQSGAPFAPPEQRIEIQLVAGGAYDPVSDLVTIDVAVSSAGPFRIQRSRASIAAAISGAFGEPIRYPGVICSREGQELYVPSFAPVVLTEALT